MKAKLITPQGVVFEKDVDEVYAPGVKGQFGVLKNHTLFFTPLKDGKLRIRSGREEALYSISSGFLEVYKNSITILADGAREVKE